MDALDKIFTNQKDINPEILAELLEPYIRINVEDNSTFLIEGGINLPVHEKLLLFLLARKVLKIKELVEGEGISPNDLVEETQLKEGSVHPGLKLLREKGLVVAKNGKYIVPNYQVLKIREIFNKRRSHGA
jgi:DNA-binding transcriptional ArsR family regulator